ncbi:MAG: hypothetical protein ACREBV_05505 [Candidatus Zixiibacteriota bacterium]
MTFLSRHRFSRLFVLFVISLALFGFVALLTHTHDDASDNDRCIACKFTSTLWLTALLFVGISFAIKDFFEFAFSQNIPRSIILISSGKRAPPCLS